MKKLFSILLTMLLFSTVLPSQAITYEEALKQSKMMAVFVYAPWVENVDVVANNIRTLEAKNKNKFNFIYLNIATRDAKKYCEDNYIYPGMPYLILMKKQGKIVRVLRDDCMANTSCIQNKMDHFGN